MIINNYWTFIILDITKTEFNNVFYGTLNENGNHVFCFFFY